MLLGAALLVLFGWFSGGGALSPPQGNDGDLYRAIVERVRAGESYYTAAGTELHGRGYPTMPPFTWRLPTLALIQAKLPGSRTGALIVTGLGVVTIFLWCVHFGTALSLIAAVLSLLTALPAWMDPKVNAFHELWAGQLVALSLAAWASGWRRVSLLAGASALAVREHALVYVVIMGVFAVYERRFREGLAWGSIAATFGIVLAIHHTLVLASLPPEPMVSSWMGWGGWSLVLATARSNFVFFGLPEAALAVAVPALWAGLFLLRIPGHERLAATVTAYFLAFAIVARPDNWYWGLLVAPLLPLGFVGLVQEFSRARAPARNAASTGA